MRSGPLAAPRGRERLGCRIEFSKHRVAALLGGALVALAVGLVAGHALIAAAGLSSVLLVGLVVPVVMTRWLTVRVEAAQARATERDVVDFCVSSFARVLRAAPGLSLRSPFGQQGYPLHRAIGDEARVKFRATRRGVYDIGRSAVVCSFPFGLLTASKPVASTSVIIVWPRPIRVEIPAAIQVRLNAGDAVWRHGDEGDFAGVRPYRRGDSMRAIHWRQTARHDRLVVRDRSAAGRPRLSCRLDCRTESYRDAEEFELAVSLAAGVVAAGLAHETSISLSIGDTELHVASEGGSRQALDALAGVQLDTNHSMISYGAEVVITSRRGWTTINRAGGSPIFVDDHFNEARA